MTACWSSSVRTRRQSSELISRRSSWGWPLRIKVMKFGGTSVATPEARLQSAMRVVSAREQGFSPVVVVSAIGRKGQPYATDTLMSMLRDIDPQVEPDAREMDLLL